jgi:hypothetical protein
VPRSLRPWLVPLPALAAGSADAPPLSPSAVHKLARLTEGRGTVAADIVAAAAAWGDNDLSPVIAGAHTLGGLLARVSEHLIGRASPAVLSTLTSAARFGAWHSRFGDVSAVPDGEADATGSSASLRPWLVALEDGWHAVRPVWWQPLLAPLIAQPAAAGSPAIPPWGRDARPQTPPPGQPSRPLALTTSTTRTGAPGAASETRGAW